MAGDGLHRHPSLRRARALRSDRFSVAVASAHRGDAFAACEFIMDYLKTQGAVLGRRSTARRGALGEARASDDDAAGRWQDAGPQSRVDAARPDAAAARWMPPQPGDAARIGLHRCRHGAVLGAWLRWFLVGKFQAPSCRICPWAR